MFTSKMSKFYPPNKPKIPMKCEEEILKGTSNKYIF